MKNIFKRIGEILFGKKDAVHPECQKVYDEIEQIKKSYISDEEFRSLNIEQQKAVLEKEISDAEYKMNAVLGKEVSLMGTSIDYNTGQPLVRERPLRTAEDAEDFISSTEQLLKNQPSKKPSKEFSDRLTKKIEFFSPEDNKEIKLDEKKSEEIKAAKKKRQYKKKKK